MWLLLALLAHDKSGEAILRRNIFCSDCRPVVHRTAKPAHLLGTLIGTQRFAIVRLEQRFAVFEIGSRLGAFSVTSIEERRIWFDDGDALELEANAVPAPPPKEHVDTRHFLEHPEDLARTITVLPDPDGVRVVALRPGSPLAQLGLQRGDVIRAVNGCELRGLDASLACYQRLRNDLNGGMNPPAPSGRARRGPTPLWRYFTVSISRAGQPLTLDVALDRE